MAPASLLSRTTRLFLPRKLLAFFLDLGPRGVLATTLAQGREPASLLSVPIFLAYPLFWLADRCQIAGSTHIDTFAAFLPLLVYLGRWGACQPWVLDTKVEWRPGSEVVTAVCRNR